MRIESLTPSPKVGGEFALRFEDGATFSVTEAEVLAFGLYAGRELDGETLAGLKAAVRTGRARRKAADLLALRPMSRRELTRKLTERGILPEDAEAAADDMERLGFLSDAEFAKTLGEHYTRKGYGPRKVRDELYRRGVPREHWPEAEAEQGDPAAAIDAFLQAKLRGGTPDRDQCRRLAAALARRGFLWSDINAALRRLGEDAPDFED